MVLFVKSNKLVEELGWEWESDLEKKPNFVAFYVGEDEDGWVYYLDNLSEYNNADPKGTFKDYGVNKEFLKKVQEIAE